MKKSYNYDNIKVIFIILLLIVITLIYLNAKKMKKSERFYNEGEGTTGKEESTEKGGATTEQGEAAGEDDPSTESDEKVKCKTDDIIVHPNFPSASGTDYCYLNDNFKDAKGIHYRGFKNKTEGGDKCLDWGNPDVINKFDDDFENKYTYEIKKKDFDLVGNYCRNFEKSDEGKPWCYYENINRDGKKEILKKDCKQDCNENYLFENQGRDYRGCIDSNVFGDNDKKCRNWTEDEKGKYVEEGADHNHCRNMANPKDDSGNVVKEMKNVWCYVQGGKSMESMECVDSSFDKTEIGDKENLSLEELGVTEVLPDPSPDIYTKETVGNNTNYYNNLISGDIDSKGFELIHQGIIDEDDNPEYSQEEINNALSKEFELNFTNFIYKKYVYIRKIFIYLNVEIDANVANTQGYKHFNIILNGNEEIDLNTTSASVTVDSKDARKLIITIPESLQKLKGNLEKVVLKFKVKDGINAEIPKKLSINTITVEVENALKEDFTSGEIEEVELGDEVPLSSYGIKQLIEGKEKKNVNFMAGINEVVSYKIGNKNSNIITLNFDEFDYKAKSDTGKDTTVEITKIKIYNVNSNIKKFNIIFEGETNSEGNIKSIPISLNHHFKDKIEEDVIEVPPDITKLNKVHIKLNNKNDSIKEIKLKNISIIVKRKEEVSLNDDKKLKEYYDKYDENTYYQFDETNMKIINSNASKELVEKLVEKVEKSALFFPKKKEIKFKNISKWSRFFPFIDASDPEEEINSSGSDASDPEEEINSSGIHLGVYRYNKKYDGKIQLSFDNKIKIVGIITQPRKTSDRKYWIEKLRYVKNIGIEYDGGGKMNINIKDNSIFNDYFDKGRYYLEEYDQNETEKNIKRQNETEINIKRQDEAKKNINRKDIFVFEKPIETRNFDIILKKEEQWSNTNAHWVGLRFGLLVEPKSIKDKLNENSDLKYGQSVNDDGDRGGSYRGFKDTTISGRLCKNWNEKSYRKDTLRRELDKDTPEERYKIYGNTGLGNHNFCRNPFSKSSNKNDLSKFNRIWCYTTDPLKGWDYC